MRKQASMNRFLPEYLCAWAGANSYFPVLEQSRFPTRSAVALGIMRLHGVRPDKATLGRAYSR